MIDKITITTDSGEQVEALAPVIISVSRSTDIPAFYVKWFFNRLAKGYCVWYNPFNRRKMYVSFERCKAIVFWTKNPKPILPYLHELDRRGIHYYFQFTLNDYMSEGFEPNVPSVTQRVETFRECQARESPGDKIGQPLPTSAWPARLPGQRHNRGSLSALLFRYFLQQRPYL